MAFYYDKDGYRVEMPSTASPSVPTSQYYYDKDGYRVPMSSAKTSSTTMPEFYYDQNGYRVEIPKTSDVEGLYNKYNELVNGYTQRYSKSGYRADYADWKRNTYNSTSEMSATSAKIRKNLETYRKVYGDEYADSVLQLIDGIDKGIVALNDAAENEYKIFSQYADENEYNVALSTYEMQQKASTLSSEERKKILKNIGKYKTVSGLRDFAEAVNPITSFFDYSSTRAKEREILGFGEFESMEEIERWESVLNAAQNDYHSNLDVSQGTGNLEALRAELEKVTADRERVIELRGNLLQKNKLGLTENDVNKLKREVKSLSLDGSEDADAVLTSYNKRVDELKKQISGLEKDLQSADKVQSFNALSAVMDPTSEFYNPDFEKYAQEGASRFGNVVEGVKNGKTAEELGISKDDYYRYKQMTDDEVKLYNYYNSSYYDSEYHDSKKQKTLIGDQFIDELDKSFNSLTARAAQMYYEENLKDKSEIEKIFSAVGSNLERWGQNLGRAWEAYVVGSINPNHYGKEYYRGDVSQGASAIAREDLGTVGKVAYDALGAVSYMLPSIATSAIVGSVSKSTGAAMFANALTMGVPVAGQAYEEMINLGYSEEQAKTYGVLAGASEFTTELFLNGAGRGLGKAVEPFANSIGKVMGRFAIEHGDEIAKFIAKAGSEAVEEMVQEVLDPILRTIATGDLHDGATIEEVLYSGLLGAITSMGINTVDVAYNKISQAVADKKEEAFTQNEQVVFDKIVENRIAELEAKGEKVTSAEKKTIKKSVRQEFENGEISTSDIEEALGEAFFGVGENDKRILSSYRETALRGETFSADLSKYSEKQRAVVQSAIDSGILNNSSRTHKFVDFVAKLAEDKGVNFSFINNQKLKESGFAIEGKDVAGYVKGNDIAVNIDSSKSLNSVVGHEIAHVLEGTELYDVLATAVKNYATTKGEWDSRLKSTAELYRGISEDAEGELVADLIGDYLFTDSKFLERLSVEHQNLFQRLWSEVKYLCRIATAGSKEARQLEKVKKAFEDAYRNTKPAEKSTDTESDGVRYAFDDNFEGDARAIAVAIKENSVHIDAEIKFEVESETLPKGFKKSDYVLAIFNEQGGMAINSQIGNVELNRSGAKSTVFHGFGKNKLAATQTIKQVIETGNIIKKTENYENTGIDRYFIAAKGTIDGEKAYVGIIVKSYPNNKKSNNKFYLHEAIMIEEDSPIMTVPQSSVDTVSESSNNSIPNSPQNVKQNKKTAKYSLSDSDGKQLTKEQAEYFKDSKIRDEEGRLLKLYHGTQNGGFTKFSTKYSDDGVSLFLTPTKELAYTYSNSNDNIELPEGKQGIARLFETGTRKGKGQAGLYEVYANAKKPYVLDGNGASWNNLPFYEKIKGKTNVHIETAFDKQSKTLTSKVNIDGKVYEKTFDFNHIEAKDKFELQRFAKQELLDYYNTFANEELLALTLTNRSKEAIIRDDETITYSELFDHKTGDISRLNTRFVSKWAKDNGYDAVIFKNIYDAGSVGKTDTNVLGDVVVVFDGSQIKSVANGQPTTDADIRYSLSEDTAEGEKTHKKGAGDYNVYGRDVKLASDEVMPAQERQNNVVTEEYDSSFEDFDRQRREDFEALDDADEVGAKQGDVFVEDNTVEVINDQDLQYITNILKDTLYLNPRQVGEVKKIVRDYSSAEHPSKTRLKAEIQSKFGTVKFAEKVEKIEAIKKELRSRDIKVSDAIKNDIADYGDFYRSHYRKLSLKESGTPVDSLYMELTNNYPNLFPEDIINPSDQLQRIAEVVDMDTYNRGEYEVDEERIQKAVDVIAEGVGRYRRVKKTSKATATTEERVFQRRQEIETHIESDSRERNRRFADYSQQIDDLMAEYDNLENQNSATAIDLQYRIQELRRKRSIDDERFSEKLKRHDKSLERVEDGTYATAIQRKSKQAELMEWAKDLLGDTSMWKDKKFGISYKVNTLHRNLRDIVRDKNGKADYKKADEIYDATAGTYNHNEALLNRESARIKKQFADMKINRVESEYIQMLGEFRHNPETTLEEQDVMNFYEKNHKKIDERKVEAAIELARKTYDDLFERVNAVLKEQGMKEIPYRKGYFPHFVEEKQGVLAKFFNWKADNNRIPDDVIGITETFKPSRSWQSFNKQREGDTTDYDFLKGLDRYIQGSLDWIYHIEDIQKRRAIENYIRYTHSEKGVQERIDEIEQSDVYNADEAEAQRNLVFAEAENSIGNFLNDFRTQTNTLAGKKSTLDRDIEELANRQVYSTMKNISGRVTANMVAGSVSSALTNFIPITQSWMQVSPKSTLVAMAETMRNVVKDDGTIEKSDFLTNRLRSSEKLDKKTWDKIIDKAGIMMEVVDNFSAQTIWRSKYNENIQKGMSEVEAIKNADEFSENVMAGRSRGNAPTLFDAKNPVAKIFTAFQLEVNNQYGYMFKDAPRDLKNEGIGKLVKGYATMFIGAYVFNALYSSLVGRDSAFDPIGIVEDLLKDSGAGDEDEKEDSVGGVVSNLIDNVIDELPFVSGIAGGGRIPINSMLPYGDVVSTVKETINDIEAGEWERLGAEWLNPVYYLGLPVGGGQIRKTVQGLSMYNTNGDRPIAGSYTDSGALRFPVGKDPFSVAQAAIFGQWSSKNARDYFDEGRSPLTDKQLSEFVQMGEDMTIQEYWDYLDDMSEFETAEEKVNYIVNLDLPLQKKNVLVNNIFNRKNPVDLQGFGELSGFAEWDFSMRNEEKYQFLKDNGISYQLYASSEEVKKTYDSDYQWYKSNPEKVTLSKAVAGTVVEYREITRAMNAIAADKDKSGNSIPGSAQEKKLDYVNGLDIDIGAKMILYKLIYTTDTQYDRDVIEYVNGLDLTAAEKKTILKELKLG